ncbi:MAG TPA: hypothetical protein DCR04_06220 [Flavobacteriales bacterium]|nr:hypothetical protein [Flavobacteriales bacterium]
MLKHLLMVALMVTFHSAFSQQTDIWSTYLENDQLKISVRTNDCDYPEKGIKNRYLLFKIENLTASAISISYDLDRSYNGKQLVPDNNGFEFSIPAQSSLQADCSNLKDGLHLFSKILNVSAKSSLSDFEFSNIVANGKNIAQ